MDTYVIFGMFVMMMGWMADHARRMGKGEESEREVWAGTGRMGLVTWCVMVFITVASVILDVMEVGG